MDTALAEAIGRRAMAHLEEAAPRTLRWARRVDARTFRNMRLRGFLRDFCFVVYASGFRWAVVEARFPALAHAFYDFDKARLARMRSVKRPLRVIANARKARNFLDGAQAVIAEGFSAYRRRVLREGSVVLQELPGIGPVTQDHLAKNIGLADVPKADVWLERVAGLCHGGVAELVEHLAAAFGETQHVVDVALWTLAKDGLLVEFGYQPRPELSSAELTAQATQTD